MSRPASKLTYFQGALVYDVGTHFVFQLYRFRFVPDKEFSGTDRSGPSGSRSGPVQFEKEEDPFGLDKFLTDVRKASSKRPTDAERSDKDKDKRRRRD